MIRLRYALIPFLGLAAACSIDAESPEPAPAPAASSPSSTTGRPIGRDPGPQLDPLEVPEWPPFGPSSSLATTCSTDRTLQAITATFAQATRRSAGGRQSAASFSGAELGEGQGRLRIRCCDTSNTCATRDIDDFIVDLSAPVIDAERLVASPSGEDFDGEIAFWVGDAWVLGSVELEYLGTKLHHEFPHAYPSTVGNEWDVSRVTFAAKDLPAGAGSATVTVRDAAGNATTKAFDLRIDGTAPTATILQPSAGAVVTGPFVVRAQALDGNNPTPARVNVWIGGTLVGEFAGPVAELTIDPSTLSSGPTAIRVVAKDDAGNESTAATTVIDVVH